MNDGWQMLPAIFVKWFAKQHPPRIVNCMPCLEIALKSHFIPTKDFTNSADNTSVK